MAKALQGKWEISQSRKQIRSPPVASTEKMKNNLSPKERN